MGLTMYLGSKDSTTDINKSWTYWERDWATRELFADILGKTPNYDDNGTLLTEYVKGTLTKKQLENIFSKCKENLKNAREDMKSFKQVAIDKISYVLENTNDNDVVYYHDDY